LHQCLSFGITKGVFEYREEYHEDFIIWHHRSLSGGYRRGTCRVYLQQDIWNNYDFVRKFRIIVVIRPELVRFRRGSNLPGGNCGNIVDRKMGWDG
jgi:hypothetical protein